MHKKISSIKVFILFISLITISISPNKQIRAMSEETIWDFHNELLYGGATYQINHEASVNNWFCMVNKTSVYVKKSGLTQEYWEKLITPQTNTYIQSIFPIREKLLLMADQGMYLYPDVYQKPNQFEKVEFPATSKTVKIIQTSPSSQETIYWIATNHGLYYSKEPEQLKASTIHWNNSDFPMNVEMKDLWFDIQRNQLFVLSSDGWLYVSQNLYPFQSIQWERIRLDNTIHSVQQIITTNSPQKIWLVSTQSQGIFLSENEGTTWKNISKALPNLYISQMKLIQNSLYASTYAGLFVYHFENAQWKQIGDSLFNEQINCFDIDPATMNIIVGTNGNGNWTTQITGEPSIWKKNDLKIEGILVKKLIKNKLETKLLLSTWGAGIYVSNNNGLSWKQSNQGLSNPYILSLFYESDERIWAGTLNGGLFYSIDFGENWNRIQSTTLLSQYFYSILVDRTNVNIIFTGTDKTIFKSVNRGESWNQLTLGTEDNPVGSITALEQDSSNPEIIYAGTDSSGLYYSKDSGETWFSSNNGFPNRFVQCLLSLPYKNTPLLAGTNGDGVYISYNQGDSWEKLQHPDNRLLVYSLHYPKEKNFEETCFLSTENGLFQLNLINQDIIPIGKSIYAGIRSALVFQKKIWIGSYGKGVASLITLPNAPLPMDPPNLAQTTKTRIMFRWSETSFSEYPVLYRVQISKDKEFTSVFYESAAVTGDQWLIPENILTRHQTYFWRVRGETSIGNTSWSKPYEFSIVTIIQMKINQPQLQINGEVFNLDKDPKVVPIIKDNRTFLPIRIIIETWQGNIEWNNVLKQVTITVDQNKISLTIQKSEAMVNGKTKNIDENKQVVPFILNGRTMLPLRFIAENLQSQVEWDAKTQQITLIYPGRLS